MCGIAGIYGAGDKELIKKMTSVLEHRGPDDEGYYVNDGVSLGNRRLSIIDLEGGHQPVHNEDESVWITYNGEVYNYRELREELRGEGHKFYTDSDTEIIVHAYEEWGEDCVRRFDGMFAFAIWDSEKGKLFLARDKFGKKPLYYTEVDGKLIFASEIKAMLEDSRIDRKVNRKALSNFLALRYVPGPETMFEGIQKLQPGCYLIEKEGERKIERYYKFGISPHFQGTKEAAAEILKGKLRESVKKWMISDVPVGAYLSGGTDSSTVVGLMSGVKEEPVRTFTVGFGEERFDELDYAREISEYFGTDHKEFLVEADAAEVLPEIVYHFDEPVADPAAIPNYLLSERAQRELKVVLTGSGGDELFGGYGHYGIMQRGEKYLPPMPGFLRNIIPGLVKRVPKNILDNYFPYASGLGEKGMERFSKYVKNVDNPKKAYLSIVSIFDGEERKEILTGGDEGDVEEKLDEYFMKNELVNALLCAETKTQLPDNLLMKVDKTSMAQSIEARTPLLNKNIADFMSKLPPSWKVRGGKDKYIFRKAIKDIVPKSIFEREKQRFFVPIHRWIEDELGWFVERVLSERRIKEGDFVDYRYIEKVLRKFDRSPIFYARQLWNLLNFELWYEMYIKGEEVSSPKQLKKRLGI